MTLGDLNQEEALFRNTPTEKRKEDWDGLERSIQPNTADDIIIGANGTSVEITAKKAFPGSL